MYQIFIDSFNRENTVSQLLNVKKNGFIYSDWYDEPMYIKDKEGNIIRWAFYGGNLDGVIRKLPYLKELGVTCIYLNPIFEAASVHKYDTANYLKIDPMLGDDEKFKELCEKAMKANIRVVLDGVFSHTGEDSMYFNKYGNYPNLGAYESKASPYFSWYKFKNFPNDYECWWGVKALPNVNELQTSYLDYIINSKDSVLNKWVNLGASGWRLDVADELPDEFIECFKCKLKETNEEAVLIGEVWEDASNKISYNCRRKYLLGKELDSVMNYPFRSLVIDFFRGYIDSYYFNRKIMSLYENYPKEVFYANMNLLGTHDTERLLTLYLNHSHCESIAVNLVKLSALLQFTFPGVPCIYYGDEAGLVGGKDPNNRKTYPWNRENFELLSWYKKITKLRSDYKVFKNGYFKMHYINEDIICFERCCDNEKGIVLINRSTSKSYEVSLKDISDINLFEAQFADGKVNWKEINDISKLKVKALEGKVLLSNLK
jgi:pullulanase